MTAQELRIGTLIEYFIGEEGIEWETNIVTADDINECDCHNEQFNRFHRPIPLTEEILLKFGFHKKGDFNCYSKSWINVCIAANGSYLYQESKHTSSTFYFVHQLQNLYFALTNQELTTK
jgi:hypothetical protein